MTFYLDCLRLIRLLRKFMTIIGLIPMKLSLRTLQISVVFLIVASVPFMRLWNAEQSVFQSDSELSRIVNISSLLVLWIVHIVILLETSYKVDKFDKILLHFEKIHKNSLFEYYRDVPKVECKAFRIYFFICLEFLELLILSWILHLDGLTWMRWSFNVYSDITLKTKLFEFIFFVILTNSMEHDLSFAVTTIKTESRTAQNTHWMSKQNSAQVLNTIGQIRNEIWMAVKMIEDLCEYSLVGVLLKMYCDITFTAYWAYRSFETGTTHFYKTVCLLFLLLRGLVLLVCCWICTSCEILERNFIIQLPQYAESDSSPHLNTIIKGLSLDLLHKRIQFSAGDIIAINVNTLGGSFQQ
ncbi:putative gustatory receptor 98a isoform X2 [Eupeodes corollae]|uniref:putative gustatory receptor 98a isoform X2 n=1 Tax=Eupeodes corollae TaxID=290404 RepID=UPI002493A1D2|nr:putative gustatory receptor 98a isoform X2 [Eupeodes corollae]